MLKTTQDKKTKKIKVTFAVADDGPVSVVGDFNQWDPFATPLKKRSNGTRSASVLVKKGSEVRFRYLADGGQFFDEPEADAIEPNGMGDTHSLIRV